jgi:hypothetical protein
MCYNICTPITQQMSSQLQINEIILKYLSALRWLWSVVRDWRPATDGRCRAVLLLKEGRQVSTKFCHKCQTEKPISEFNKSSLRADGLQTQCRDCHRITKRTYSQTERGKQVIKASIAKFRPTEKFRNGQLRRAFDYEKRNREKVIARRKVNQAIKKGLLTPANERMCQHCHVQWAKEYHHYNGYTPKHWFDIIPVCIGCHSKIHGRV